MVLKIARRGTFLMMISDKNDNYSAMTEMIMMRSAVVCYWRLHDNVGVLIIIIAIASLSSLSSSSSFVRSDVSQALA